MSALLLAAMMLQSSAYHDEPYNGAECDQAAADRGIQIEMNICAWREHEAEDDRLNVERGPRIRQVQGYPVSR